MVDDTFDMIKKYELMVWTPSAIKHGQGGQPNRPVGFTGDPPPFANFFGFLGIFGKISGNFRLLFWLITGFSLI